MKRALTDQQFCRLAAAQAMSGSGCSTSREGATVTETFRPLKAARFLPIPTPVACHHNLSGTEKLVYGALLRRAGNDGLCFPLIETLARDIGKKRTATKDALRGLKEKGLIKSSRQPGRGSSTYEFLRHPIFDWDLDSAAKPVEPCKLDPSEGDDGRDSDPMMVGMPTTEEKSEENKSIDSRKASLEGESPEMEGRGLAAANFGQWRRWAVAMCAADRFPLMGFQTEQDILAKILEPSPPSLTDDAVTAAIENPHVGGLIRAGTACPETFMRKLVEGLVSEARFAVSATVLDGTMARSAVRLGD